jgi:hypothetical protein
MKWGYPFLLLLHSISFYCVFYYWLLFNSQNIMYYLSLISLHSAHCFIALLLYENFYILQVLFEGLKTCLILPAS